MKYMDLLWALDLLSRYYPRYYSHEVIQLADDIFKWLNNDLPHGSSTLAYLESCFSSPTDALRSVWAEILLIAGPYMNRN